MRLVTAPGGTAHFGTALEYWDVIGKTGTGQNSLSVQGLAEEHAWFAGMAGPPGEDPEIVVVVIVEYGASGSGTAAPIMAKTADFYLRKKYGIPIDTIQTYLDYLRAGKPAPWYRKRFPPKKVPEAVRGDRPVIRLLRRWAIDPKLVLAIVGLTLFGIAMIYSAGEVHIPNPVTDHAWLRQSLWLVLALDRLHRDLARTAEVDRVGRGTFVRRERRAARDHARDRDGLGNRRGREELDQPGLHPASSLRRSRSSPRSWSWPGCSRSGTRRSRR